jgi:HJR/Mrr/RecB family endonuclease
VSEWQKAVELLDRFEGEGHRIPVEAERLVAQILRACGHDVKEAGFAQSDVGVDCFFDTCIGPLTLRIGVEVRSLSRPVGVEAIQQAFALRDSGHFDRAMIVSRSGFSAAAQQQADTAGAGKIDLLGPSELRSWLAKHEPAGRLDTPAHDIVRSCMRELAMRLAQHPEELPQVEWRDLERILLEVFEALGYATRLTRSGKDGGFDLELTFTDRDRKMTYLVEVKHWTDQKPGLPHLSKLIEVTASRNASGAVLLSTSGFSKPLYSGLLKVSAPVRIGDASKVVSLCQTYYRLQTGFWLDETNLAKMLHEGTHAPGAL